MQGLLLNLSERKNRASSLPRRWLQTKGSLGIESLVLGKEKRVEARRGEARGEEREGGKHMGSNYANITKHCPLLSPAVG